MAELYYGVSIPPDIIENLDPDKVEVKPFYIDKTEVMKVLKEIKTARFKVFKQKEEAIEFSQSSPEPLVIVSDPGLLASPKPSEKCEFRSLKPQEEVRFRKAIEASPSDLEFLAACVEENARYLVTPSDTPTILQQGQRHNALHVAARHGKVEAARLVLGHVTGDLVARMYPGEAADQNQRRRERLVDLYLNMPDKGGGDTPLHLAAKWGHLEMVRLVMSYTQTSTDMTNKFGEVAAAVVCSRARERDADTETEIREILAGQVVIPVYREESSKHLGRPISLQEAATQLQLPADSSCDLSLSSSVASSPLVQSRRCARVNTSTSQLDLSTSSPVIAAVLGPVSSAQASRLYRSWRAGSEAARERLEDPALGAERQGRDLASQHRVDWLEWWPWLGGGTYTDLATEPGLQLLELHLDTRTRAAVARLQEQDIEAELEAAALHDDSVFSGELELVTKFCSTPARPPPGPAWRPHHRTEAWDSQPEQDTGSLALDLGATAPAAVAREPLSPLSSLMTGLGNLSLAADSAPVNTSEVSAPSCPASEQPPPSSEVTRRLGQFCSTMVALLADSVPTTEAAVSWEVAAGWDWVAPLASHWAVVRRRVNNWRSDPGGRWAAEDWDQLAAQLLGDISEAVTLELGPGLDRDRVAAMLGAVASLAATARSSAEDAEEEREGYERGRQRHHSEGQHSAAVRDIARLCGLVSRQLTSGPPGPGEVAGLWDLATENRRVATSRVNRARRFLHSSTSTDTSRGSRAEAITSSCDPAASPGTRRRQSLHSEAGSEASEDQGWVTPPSSPGASSVASMETCAEGDLAPHVWVAGDGTRPTREDRRVAEALARVRPEQLASLPHVAWYLAHLAAYTRDTRLTWPEPDVRAAGDQFGGLARRLDLDFTSDT